MADLAVICPFPDCGRQLEGLATFCWSCMRRPDEFRAADARPATADTRSEAEIQHGIRGALRAMGFDFWDTSQPFKAAITPGLPDLFVIGRGVSAWIEVKSAQGKLTDAQETFRDKVVAAGGNHLVARSESEVVEFLTSLAAGVV